MGKSTAEELGVLKIMINALSNDELFSAYPNVVNKKLGKLKDCEVKLHIDRTVPPVANKHPKMDDMVERYVNSCHECAMNTNTNNQVPLSMSELPDGPWMNISMDFCGPIPSGEYLFVIVDEYSRFPVVEIVNNLSAEKIIPVVDKVFSTFSYPVQVKTDNGTPF